MGDRNNPIKFGPEWLRNFSREGGSGNSNNSQGASNGPPGNPNPSTVGPGSNIHNTPAAAQSSKVHLAKLRYGREEMLALYEKSEPPAELKYFDLLYNPRGKSPIALSTTFDEDMRENLRTGPPNNTLPPGERFTMGRGMVVNDGRTRGRMPFVRQTSTSGRGYVKAPLGYQERAGEDGAFDSTSSSIRPWSNNNGNNTSNRNGMEPNSEWGPNANKAFRSRWQGSTTNWRRPQSNRDEGEEWRAVDSSRPRSMQPQEKWDRDWGERGERGSREKTQWHNNRRTWVGDNPNSEDNLPEWAMDNMEACGGTFDSLGAFHGYSDDDSNIQKPQGDPIYPLTRSHTQVNFTRSKPLEEGSDEWWASEKAKKLSPKRFDTNEIKFKKGTSGISEPSANNTTDTTSNDTKSQELPEKIPKAPEASNSEPEKRFSKKNVHFKQNLVESKTFDALMRSDINMDEASDERGNFKSVMITPNNSLRQKHQNIVSTASEVINRQNTPSPAPSQMKSPTESDQMKQHISTQKIMEGLIDFAFEDKELPACDVQSTPNVSTGNDANTTGMGMGISNIKPMTSAAKTGLQLGVSSTLSNQGMTKPGVASSNLLSPGHYNCGMPNTGMSHSNSMGLPMGTANPSLGIRMPLSSIPTSTITQQCTPRLPRAAIISAAGLTGNATMSRFSPTSGISILPGSNVTTNSLFMSQNGNNSMTQSSDLHRQASQSQSSPGNMFPVHGLQQQASQSYSSSIYSNMMQQPPPLNPTSQSLAEQWYYEDPKKVVQGPFSAKDMYNWYRAGFFTSSLMVRRACDAHMRPLGSYGPVVPFATMDIHNSSFPMTGGFDPRTQSPRDSVLSQQGLGLGDVMNMSNMGVQDPTMESLQYGNVGNNFIRNAAAFSQQPMENLWTQPSASSEMMWMQQSMSQNEPRVNNLPMYFWDQQPTAIASNPLLPKEITKDMKTEEQILAQLRASQNKTSPHTVNYPNKDKPLHPGNEDRMTSLNVAMTPDLGELEKLIQKDTLSSSVTSNEIKTENQKSVQTVQENIKAEENESSPIDDSTKLSSIQATDNKQKSTKSDVDKAAKNKENLSTKNKKKTKEDKKDEAGEAKSKDDESNKTEKKNEEMSPVKSKKEDKMNKKELEKEKKEWIKEGFTIVKGTEKPNKDVKKKTDELKAAEEAERKRKEEEKVIIEEEKRRKQAEALKKQQQEQQQQPKLEVVIKKAPWSAVATPSAVAPSREDLTLAEIQRLEREKKLEQQKEQQAMMEYLAQRHQAALAREQEMQSNLCWAKKKANMNFPGQSLAEIQAEARKQSVAAAAAAAAAAAVSQVIEEPQLQSAQVPNLPWGSIHNGSGFWDTERVNQINPINTKLPEKVQESLKMAEPVKTKKKASTPAIAKKEASPAHEFENWCNTVLGPWNSKIDAPTFVGFLKDIESPFEVKEYIKCYLGESKESSDFARQFLEKRSKLLRAVSITPVDDLCSPAAAINPRLAPGADYQEVKGKGKKTKKNKMLKVDARILGFSVTAAEDRINVGDIDSV